MLILRGTSAVTATLVGRIVLALAHGVIAVQAWIPGAQDRLRGLTDAERATLRTVFGDALDLGAIRLLPGRAGVLGASPRAVTLGTTIVLKGRTSPSLLVHEAVHVWQYRRLGARYVVDAVRAQRSRVGYDWRAAGVERWADHNLEAQAQCVQDLHAVGWFADPRRDPVVDGRSYREIARDAARTLRSAPVI